jgi:hypothetical protein
VLSAADPAYVVGIPFFSTVGISPKTSLTTFAVVMVMVDEPCVWWQTHRHPTFLFPGPSLARRECSLAVNVPLHKCAPKWPVPAVPNTFRLARAANGLPAAATVLTLFLTAQNLGHASLETTLIYAHLTAPLNKARTRAVWGVLHRAGA